jgi:myo-inositol-1(or 4)-monophosphatase
MEADLELALRAVRAAGAAVLPAFRAGCEVRYKSPDQPVTDADLLADRTLRELLQGERPGYGWLSEETRDSEARLACERVWVVDPIDGTNSFVLGIPEFAVSVALVERGQARLGVVLNPATGELYHAVAGQGAWLNGAPIRMASDSSAADRPRMVSSRWEMERGELRRFAAEWELLPLGSTAYKLARVAQGGAEAFVSAGHKHEWDVAGAALLVQEAGGTVTDLAGRPYRYNQPDPSRRGVVASVPALHAGLLSAIGG